MARDLANRIADMVDDIGKARKDHQQELRNQAIPEDKIEHNMQLNVVKFKGIDGVWEKRFNRWMFRPLPKNFVGNAENLAREIKEAKAMDDENKKPINGFEKADKEAEEIEANKDDVAEKLRKVFKELLEKENAALHGVAWDANPDDHLQLEVKALGERWKAGVNKILQMEADHDMEKNQEDLVDPNNPILEEPAEAPHQNAFEDLGGKLNVNINVKQKDNKQMITNVTIGADPELFIFNTATKSVVSSIGLIPGEKGKPWRDKKWAKGFGLEIDNILGEFNIPPAHTKDEFIESINFMKKYIREFVKKKNPDYDIRCRASYMVPEDQLQSEEAKMFGCSIDFNAYTEDVNPKPEGEKTNLRSAGQVKARSIEIYRRIAQKR